MAATDLTVTVHPGAPNLLLGSFDVTALGYTVQEFLLEGTATAYTPVGELGADGRWTVEPAATAPFVTRAVALRPENFSGTVVVEWLNVSGGIDAPAEWFTAHREIVRAGHAYVAVSVQEVGVQGGASMTAADMSLKTLDPARYAPLHHPGDAWSFDIFSQAGRAAARMLDLAPDIVLAAGESQSAMFLTTYVNAVDPLAQVFDGFLVHSRFGTAAALDGTSLFTDRSAGLPEAPRFRPDLRVPVVAVLTETDVVGGIRPGYHLARQPDGDRLRVWEIAGAAHADTYTIAVAFVDDGSVPAEDLAAGYAPTREIMGETLPHSINFAPQHHYVVQAALAALVTWTGGGPPPPAAEPLALTGDPVAVATDGHGVARGGVRTPWVDVPAARTSGTGAASTPLAALFGSGEQFDAAELRALYPEGFPEYLERFEAALERAVAGGFLLAADRDEILALAAATYPA